MRYFFDTNIIIDIFDKKLATITKLKEIINENESEIIINNLVYVEALRTINIKHKKIFREAKSTLDSFHIVNITKDIYDEAIAFSRFCHSKGIKLKGKCEAIDFIHFITAKYYYLEIISNDKDLDKLEEIYQPFKDYLKEQK
jgi:predicted nucleic acid-binding protein